ncbi:MAG: DeoR/GlpR family DNA-binding transcription regulator [Pleomorphochaeta sp.]
MNKKQIRINNIESILKKESSKSIQDLAELLNVSNMTIRRDLQDMERNHIIHLYNGIAVLDKEKDQSVNQYLNDIQSESVEKQNIKIKIGKLAADYIKKDDIVLFDNGSTINQIIKQLLPEMPITIVSYNLNAIVPLFQNPNYNLIVPGGYLHRNTGMLQSEEAVSLISRIGINKAFISASGISSLYDVTTVAEYEIDIKKAVIKTAVEKILVVDSDKFNKVCVAKFATLKDFDTIITDSNIPEDVKTMIYENDIKLILTDED